MVKNILITGGAGFIGSNLALRLLSYGYNITVLDNLSEQIHGSDPNKSLLYNSIKDKVNFILGDVCNENDWIKSIENQDVIIHLAAETGTGQSMYEVEKYVNVNVRSNAILLNCLSNKKNKIQKIIVASSRAVYGEGKYSCSEDGVVFPIQRSDYNLSKGDFNPKCPICDNNVTPMPTDEKSPLNPVSIYGITKQNQEQLISLGCKSLGISSIIYRYQNVYGPGQSLSNPYTGILSIFSTRILNNNQIEIFEDGLESRDFVYIDDVVDATFLGLKITDKINTVFNVGSGRRTSVLNVAKTLEKHYKFDANINISGRYRIGDIRHNFADISKITKIGFSPKVSFTKGLEKFSNWVKKQKVCKDYFDLSIQEMQSKGLIK
tara:strand:+ start:92 stop:1225 length:1134 start_codon:yes stop_codon:yes gene_type:complete